MVSSLFISSALRRALRATVALLLVVPALQAQERGTIRGVVRAGDGANAVIAGAEVSVINPRRSATTNASGEYVLRDLPGGTYDVTAFAVGRAPSHLTVRVAAGEAKTTDFVLQSGSLLLSGVVVSATKTPVEASKVAGTINFLTPEQVRASPARETQDMLREISAIEMPRTSSQVGGTAQIVSIRGVDEGRTAVLLDGIPLNDAWGEWIDWNRAPKGSIDRVEVLEGGGSNLHGNGAMGGVISLFSRPVVPGGYRMIVDGGERGGRHAFASVGVPIVGALSLGLSGDYGDGGGYQLIKPGTGGPIDGISQAIVRNGSARLEYAPSSDISGFVTGHLFSDNRGLGTPMTKSWRTDGSTDAGLNIGHAETGYLTVRGWWRGMTENSVGATALTVATVPRAGERLSATATIPSQDRGVALAWTRAHLLGFESISLGGDYRFYGGYYNEQAYANNAANLPTTLIKSGGEQLLSGAFISGLLAPADAWRIELSARVDRWGNNNGYVTDASGTTNFANATRTAFSPRVGVRYELTKSLSFHTAAYQAFRAPNLAELYRRQVSATTVSLPNPDLKPEFATGYEGGVSWQPASWLQVKGTVYRAVYKDFNTFVTTSATGVVPATRQRQNVQGARSLGGEAYVALRPIEGLTISGSLNYNDSQMTDLGPIAPSAVTFVGARVARVPTQKSTERISYESRTLGTFTLLGRTESVVTTFGNAFTLPAYKIADASYSRPLIGGASVFMSLENIFNAEYLVSLSGAALSPVTSLGLPRTFRMGLEIARF